MFTHTEKNWLLNLARQTLQAAVNQRSLPGLESAPPKLLQPGAAFVTLSLRGALRGCVGSLEAYRPLAEDVREHTLDAALYDYRFAALSPAEEPQARIEISVLTPPQPLTYASPRELLQQLRPGVDGVTLRDGARRATFLPQVWQQLPQPRLFLQHLCEKMGVAGSTWESKPLQVFVYQVEAFEEEA